MLQVPVLLIIFNRPETTKKTFEAIKKTQPAVLYIAADGPRNEEEKKLCNSARKITEDIDWNCEIHRLYRDNNLGCKDAVVGSINWFFEKEEMGIILEDDCVAEESFFSFCSHLLTAYKDDLKVKTVSGTNFLFGAMNNTDDYFFIDYTMMWGWATWRRAWLEVDWNHSFDKQIIEEKINQTYHNEKFRAWIKNLIYHFYDNFETIKDIWDIHVLTTFLLTDGLQIIPSKNLIKNIGIEGTHSFIENKSINAATSEIVIENLSLKKTANVSTHIQNLFMENVVNVHTPKETIVTKLKRKIRQYIR